ncbi:MAG: polysaccharide biosynthesis protein [Pararhodobacter sp.]|nr:polysaccharide biosynthesis protein [Pararhodobacter sp.]
MNEVISHLTGLTRPAKRALQLLADSVLIVLSLVVAMALRLESLHFLTQPLFWLTLLPVVPLTLLVFWQLGLYHAIIRFIAGHALRVMLVGVVASGVILLVAAQALSAPVPRSVPGIYALLLFFAGGGLRLLVRKLFLRPAQQNRIPVIIYGAGDAGRQVANALYHGNEYMPVAFVDDDPALQHTTVIGRRVFEPGQIPFIIREMRANTVLLAIPSASRARRREIVARLEPLRVRVKTMPGMADIVSGRARYSDLRNVTPEELLGRDPVPARPDLMGRNITGKVVLVSGAGGSIGSELCRQIIKQEPAALVLLEVSELALYDIATELRETLERDGRSLRIEPVLGSVQNPGRIRAILSSFGVQTIYHAAAYKHVVIVQENVAEGVRNNVFGTRVLAEAAAELGVENFILVSTDKAVRPANFMGASKRMAELVCQALAQSHPTTVFSMVRFGNVLGSSGSVIPRFVAQIERGGPVTVTHPEITRFFMTISEAAQLVIQAGAMATGGDVFVLDMGRPVKILKLAKTMVRLYGLKPYVVEGNESPDAKRGDIPIRIVGLNKGEKLFEELLINGNPHGTHHPRIMTTTEVSMPADDLNRMLDRLMDACQNFDLPEIRQIFIEAPLAYSPRDDKFHDLVWNAGSLSEGGDKDMIKIVVSNS